MSTKARAGVLAFGIIALASVVAQAQSALPSRGSFAFSGERLFGFYGYQGTASQADFEDRQSGTQFSFLWASNHTAGPIADANPDAVPRLAFDYFITEGMTLGAAAAYYSASGEYKHEQLGEVDDNGELADISSVAFAPRAGYLFRLGAHGGIWPRVGLTYVATTQKAPGNNKDKMSVIQTNLEAMVVLAPARHFAFVLGPVLDLPMSGKVETTRAGVGQPDTDVAWRSMGFVVGVSGYL